MIRPCLLLLFLLAGLASCAADKRVSAPEMLPSVAPPMDCRVFFPQGNWQFVHSISFAMEDGRKGHALGLLILAPGEIRCALMTVEGLTLFEARVSDSEEAEGSLEVTRALPPFDNPAFALGLMQDIRALFRPPSGAASWGRLDNGGALCRYHGNDGDLTDILPEQDGCWTLRSYSRKKGEVPALLYRAITTSSCVAANTRMPETLDLHGLAPQPYHLTLRLLSAESLD